MPLTWSFIGTLAVQGGRLLLLLLLARLLPKDAFGTFALVQVCFGFASFFADAGLSNVLYQPDALNRETRSTLFWAGLLLTALLSVLLLLLSGPLGAFYNNEMLTPGVQIAALALLLAGAGAQQRMMYRRDLRFKALAVMDISALVVQAVLSIGLAYRGAGAMALVWGHVGFHAAATFLYFIFLGKNALPDVVFSREVMRQNRAFGLFQIGERSLNYLAERTDTLIIGKVLGPGPLGMYDVMKQLLARPEALVNPAVCQVALPRMAALKNDLAAVKKIYLENLALICKINFPIYILLIFSAKPVLLLLFGPEWAAQSGVFVFLALYYMIHSAYNPIGALQMAKGRADLGFYFNLLLFVTLPIAAYLGACWGIKGVAQALFLYFAALGPIYYFLFLRPLLNPPSP